MMLKPAMTPLDQQIDAALHLNLDMLKAGFFEFLAALLLIVIAVFSLFGSVVRMTVACLGLLLWAVALFVTFLSWLRSKAVAHSSLYKSFRHDEIGGY